MRVAVFLWGIIFALAILGFWWQMGLFEEVVDWSLFVVTDCIFAIVIFQICGEFREK